jgi:hypothetical protein
VTESAFSDRRVAALLQEPTASGESLKSWVENNIPAEATIVASDGQATAYVLRRKTVSVVGRGYGYQEWEEPQLRELMSRFHADFLILYLDAPTHAVPAEQRESNFLMALTQGGTPTDWLQLAARNAHIMIFRRIGVAGERRGGSGETGRRFISHDPLLARIAGPVAPGEVPIVCPGLAAGARIPWGDCRPRGRRCKSAT